MKVAGYLRVSTDRQAEEGLMLADHITAFALHGIRGLANEKDPA